MRFPILVIVVCLGILAGCSSAPKFACGLPDGVGCKSVSEVYAGAKNNISFGPGVPADNASNGAGESPSPRPVVATVKPGKVVLTTPEYVRMWINRWEDGEGDMRDETFVYLRLNNGHWTLKK